MLSNEDHLRNDLDCGAENNISAMINDLEPPPPCQTKPEEPFVEEPKVLKEHQNEEGTKERVTKDIFPQINNELSEQKTSIIMKRSDSALNIFDQSSILKLFSAKNWTETFFNRIFRKKFLVISGDDSLLATLKHDGPFAIEQQLMHLSQKYPRDFLLPAIASERVKKTNHGHGLCCSQVPVLHAARTLLYTD
jgi:hypothetical protein